jgi:hypothetical protein
MACGRPKDGAQAASGKPANASIWGKKSETCALVKNESETTHLFDQSSIRPIWGRTEPFQGTPQKQYLPPQELSGSATELMTRAAVES